MKQQDRAALHLFSRCCCCECNQAREQGRPEPHARHPIVQGRPAQPRRLDAAQDTPFVPAVPVTRDQLNPPVPMNQPSVGLYLTSANADQEARWNLKWTNGWVTKTYPLDDYLFNQPSGSGSRSTSTGAILAPDGGAVAVVATSNIPFRYASHGFTRMYQLSAPDVQGQQTLTPTVLPAPDWFNPALNESATPPGLYASYLDAAVTSIPGPTAGSSKLRIYHTLVKLTETYVQGADSILNVSLGVYWSEVNSAGQFSGWSYHPYITRTPVPRSSGYPYMTVRRTANTADGALYLNVNNFWFKIDAQGIADISESDVPWPGAFHFSTINPQTGQTVQTPTSWPLTWGPYYATVQQNTTPGMLSPGGGDGVFNWMKDLPATVTVTAREKLKGGKTLLHYSHVPTGLHQGWPNASYGDFLPHLPGTVLDDPDGALYEQFPPGTLLTQAIPTGQINNVMGSPVLDFMREQLWVQALGHHPYDRPDRPPLSTDYNFNHWVDLLSVPDISYAVQISGHEYFPSQAVLSSGTLSGDPAALTRPATTSTIQSLLSLQTQPSGDGRHRASLTFTFPPAGTGERDRRASLILKADWRAIEGGNLTVKLNGSPIYGPALKRGWWQFPEPGVGSTVTLELDSIAPAQLGIAQLSILTVNQEAPL